MRNIVAVIVLALVGLMAACGPVSSLNPLFTTKDVVFDAGLLGEWTEAGPHDFSLRFEKAGSNGYRVIDTEFDGDGASPKQTVFDAHLVSLGGRLFLDVVPEQIPAQSASYQMDLTGAPNESTHGSGLLRLGDGFYAEISGGASPATGSAGNLNVNLKQAHWIFRVQNDGTTLRLANMDEDWLKKAVEQGQISVSNKVTTDEGHELVLTADTQELQQFIVEHADDTEAFQQTTELHRIN
jgi:hypothetical protein